VRVRLSDRRVLADALTQGMGVLESELPGVLMAFDRYDRSKDAAEEAIARAVGDDERAHRVRQFAAALGDSKDLLDTPAADPRLPAIPVAPAGRRPASRRGQGGRPSGRGVPPPKVPRRSPRGHKG